MQVRIRNDENAAADAGRSRFLRVSSAIFVAGSVLLALPSTSEAFVPHSVSQNRDPSSKLFYTMPDVTNMKARDMRQELESYGVNTQTLFDKREFEQALIEARRNYEQTLNDVMNSNRPKEKKKVQQPRRKTVHYDRDRHRDERIYSSDVNDQPPGMDNRYSENNFRRQQQQNRHRQWAEPNPVGNFDSFQREYGAPNAGGDGRRPPRPENGWFEEDPLFAHERGQGFRPDVDRHHYHQDSHHDFETYEVGARKKPQKERSAYRDPTIEMKYQQALQDAYAMKVEDLQYELNCRGISTRKCMIVKDFCIEYAKAVAEDRQKVAETPSAESIHDDDDEDEYDPEYKDVVMQKYDASMWM